MGDVDARYHDFDAEWEAEDAAAEERRPLRFKVYGKVHEVPYELPAAWPMRIALWSVTDPTAELTNAQQLVLAGDLFPTETLEEWFAHRMSAGRLGALVKWLLDLLMEGGDAPADVLDAPAPPPEAFRLPDPET